MMDAPNQIHSTLNGQIVYPWFPEQTILAGGCLPDSKESMACWYYYLIAQRAKILVGVGPDDQTLEYKVGAGIMEMPLWVDKRFAAQAKGVAKLYDVTIESMFAHWPAVISETIRLGMDLPETDYMNPGVEDRIT